MKILSLDLETFSDIDLRKCGVYRYTNSPNFDILLFAYSIDEESVELIDLASGEEIPEKLMDAILSKEIIKTAFNANFERVALMRYLSRILGRVVYLDPSSWICSMSQAVLLGLPLNLEGVAKVLRLDAQKMAEGKALIRYFCIPCKATAANGGRKRNLPSDAPEKWELFKKYNIRDVEVELAIREKLSAYQIPDNEQEIYVLDQNINDRGLEVDMVFVDEAISCNRQFTVAATERAYELTGLENPNSVAQIKKWLSERGVEVESLSKKAVTELVDETEGEVEEALKLRLLMAKTSVKKYEAIERAVCSDGRVHGLFQYYGANRTGRWCLAEGTPVRVKTAENLILDKPIEEVQVTDHVWDGEGWVNHEGVVYSGDKEVITWDGVTASEEHIVYISDDEKISLGEAKERAIELWNPLGEVCHEVIGKQYCSTYDLLNAGPNNRFMASGRIVSNSGRLVQFQNLPQNHLRDLNLARDLVKESRFDDLELLFGNTPNVLSELIRTAFIPKENHRFIVADFSAIEARVISWLAKEKWRLEVFASHGKIYEAAAARIFNVPIEKVTKSSPLRQRGKISELACGFGGGVGALKAMGALEMGVEEHELQGLIDNWRAANPHIVKLWWEVDKAAITAVKERTRTSTHGIIFTYKSGMLFVTLPSGRNLVYVKPKLGLNKFGREGLTYEGIGTTKKWERIETYGPKIVENIVQAVARDLLAEAMLRLDQAGYQIVAHVHDEVICEVPNKISSVEEVCSIMGESVNWAPGLPLKADGYECDFYKKD